MSLANLKAITEYQEAIQATEEIESPAVSFAKTFDYKGGLTNQVNDVIKQNNTLLYLASRQSQKLIELKEKFDRLKKKVYTIIKKEIQPADLEDSISSLAKRLDNFSISEDQICGYRAMTRGRYQAARATRRVFGRNNYNITLESAVDPERQLKLSRERPANLVPAEVLYSNNRSTARHKVFQPYLLADISWIRLHALHRRSAGTNRLGGSSETPDGKICGKSLVPWSRSLFRNTGSGIRITWQGGEYVDNVVDDLITTGITTIPVERRSVESA
ncbi:hypothetical protein Tco_0632722 [Tanacetum coccineum]